MAANALALKWRLYVLQQEIVDLVDQIREDHFELQRPEAICGPLLERLRLAEDELQTCIDWVERSEGVDLEAIVRAAKAERDARLNGHTPPSYPPGLSRR